MVNESPTSGGEDFQEGSSFSPQKKSEGPLNVKSIHSASKNKQSSANTSSTSSAAGRHRPQAETENLDDYENENNPNHRWSPVSNSPRQNEGLERAQDQQNDFGSDLKSRGRYLKDDFQSRVRASPWSYIGGFSVAGLVVGFLVGRKFSR